MSSWMREWHLTTNSWPSLLNLVLLFYFQYQGKCVSSQIWYLGHSISVTNSPLSHGQSANPDHVTSYFLHCVLFCLSWNHCPTWSPPSLPRITARSPKYPHMDLALSFTIHLKSHHLIFPTCLPLATLPFFSPKGFPELSLVASSYKPLLQTNFFSALCFSDLVPFLFYLLLCSYLLLPFAIPPLYQNSASIRAML